VDSLTHALAAAILAYVLGFPQYIPFIVLGAAIIDADVLFGLFSKNSPRLYLFVHGGIAHSLIGVCIMSAATCAGIGLAALAGLVNPLAITPTACAAVFAGGFLHIAMDLPASPGIPLLFPKSDKKYALFILPGPSLLLLAVSLFFVIWMALGVVTLAEGMAAYAAIFFAFLFVRSVAFVLSRPALTGAFLVLPQPDPRRWLAFYDDGDSWRVADLVLGKGFGVPACYEKYTGTDPAHVAPYRSRSEVRRLMYNSYIVTAKLGGGTLVLADPVRESGRLFYPPHYKRVTIPV
jgi:Predicted membrane-bound metal-dependent hydrolases